jgi:Predicted nucleotide kinase (related to CMP and AMP kinases)
VTDDPATTDDPMMTDTIAAGESPSTDEATTSDDTPTNATAGDDVAMRVAVTGTPGTGKTTATDHLAADIDAEIIHLNDAIRENDLYTERDADRDSLVADLDAVSDHLGEWTGVLESHLAHHVDADRVVVLRCEPGVLEDRLRDRGETAEKARENAESEALDVVLSEAVDQHGLESVYEINTTDREPATVAAEIAAVRAGDREPTAGEVAFTGYLTE